MIRKIIREVKVRLVQRFDSIDEAKRFIDQQDGAENFEIIVLWDQDISEFLNNKKVR